MSNLFNTVVNAIDDAQYMLMKAGKSAVNSLIGKNNESVETEKTEANVNEPVAIINQVSDDVQVDNSDAVIVIKETLESPVDVESVFSEAEYEEIRLIASDESLSEYEKKAKYAALVSDNHGSFNEQKTYEDGTVVDISEMSIMKKTQLDGKFQHYDKSGMLLDYFGEYDDGSEIEIGTTKNVCGGTITYKGQGDVERIQADDNNSWWDKLTFGTFNKDFIVSGEARGSIVHYEGELGSFDYNTREYRLAYYTDENGIAVPVLHYIGDIDGKTIGGVTKGAVRNGKYIDIPNGIKCCDYMFAESSINSMPALPASIESAHGMFKNCKQMTSACDEAVDENGKLLYPSKLEDMSWMFAGSKINTFFGEFGKNTLDARCAAQECTNLGNPTSAKQAETLDSNVDSDEVTVTSELDKINNATTFVMPDTTKCRYLSGVYCKGMLDGCSVSVEGKLAAYMTENGLSDEGYMHISEWADEEGVLNNILSKVDDGSWNVDKVRMIQTSAARRKVLTLIDPAGTGMTGTESRTGSAMSYSVQITNDGVFADSSTWSALRQNEQTFTDKGSSWGDLLDKGAAFLGTFGLSAGVLKGVTKNKWISLVGGLAVATIPQVVGTANELSPLLDTVAGWLGKDNKIGQFLSNMSTKLKGEGVSYSTKVHDLDIDGVFLDQQDASVKFARQQVGRLMSTDKDMLYDSDGNAFGAEYVCKQGMYANGKNLAQDGNLITIALTEDSILKSSLNLTLMNTIVDGIDGNLKADIANNGNVLSDVDKAKYSEYYVTIMSNLNAYSQGALDVIDEKYIVDVSSKDKAMNGLSKVMRNTAEPVYESMYELQQTYGIFTEEQLQKLDSLAPSGMPKFSEYTGEDITPEDADKYVNELAENKLTLKEQMNNAKSSEEYQSAFTTYYENSYGYLIDEAEKHNIRLAKTVETPEFENVNNRGNEDIVDDTSSVSNEQELG